MKRGWTADEKPDCFESVVHWNAWLGGRTRASRPCVDCSPEYQAEKITAGKCARLDAVFVIEDGETVGYTTCDRGYSGALRRQVRTPEIVDRLKRADVPKLFRTVIDAWIEKGKA